MIEITTRRGELVAADLLRFVNGDGHIAGGFARWCASPRDDPAPPADVDVFPASPEGHEALLERLAINADKEHENQLMTLWKLWREPSIAAGPENRLVPLKVQVIKPFRDEHRCTYGTLEEVLDDFDLTVTRCGLRDATTALVHEQFEEDERERVIRWANIDCPIGAMLRAMKYARKGYRVRAREATRLFEEWLARDESYRSRLVDLMRTEDPSPEQVDELERLLHVD